MKLTDRIILRDLKESGCTSFQVTDSSSIGKTGRLEGALCLEPQRPDKAFPVLEENTVYVLQEGTLLRMLSARVWMPEQILLIVLDNREGKRLPGMVERMLPDTPIIRLQGENCRTDVLNELLRIFRRYGSWETHLMDLQAEFASVEEMLYDSMEILQNPLLLFYDDMSVRAEVTRTALPEKVRFWRMKDPEKQIERINEILQDPYLAQQMQQTGAYPGPEEVMGIRSFMLNLFPHKRTSYFLCVMEQEKKLDEADRDLLEILCAQICYQLKSAGENRSRRVRQREVILTRLLQDPACDYGQFSRELTETGWSKEHRYLCLVLHMSYPDKRRLPADTVCGSLEERFEGCCSFAMEGEILTYFNLTLCRKTQEEISFELTPFIRDSFLKAGYSREIGGHEYLKQLYAQAAAALALGTDRAPHIWIHQFDTYALDYLLEQMKGSLPGELLCHPGLWKLYEQDRQSDTQYTQTLFTYLNKNQNAVHSAKELGIHRSTFLYRLEKIRETVRCDFDNPEEMLYLQLSFRFLEGFC